MKRVGWVLGATLLAVNLSAAPSCAQSFSRPDFMTADHNMRTSKMIGMTVYNDRGEKIGTLDELLMPAAGGEVTAVISVGGFLGIGEKLVKVPLNHIHFMPDKAMMPDGGKAALTAMPAYSYRYGGGG